LLYVAIAWAISIHREQVSVEASRIQRKVLMVGANALVRDDVRVLLRSMGYHCVGASTLKKALDLPGQEKPDAAILDPNFPDSPGARVVAMFHKRVPDLRGRLIVLVRAETDPELLRVLDAYSLRRTRGASFTLKSSPSQASPWK